ncbi:MAG: protein translocase subunit SecF, partial [Actinobacteria bacterium]|nr:protein translocase subunit SecF [Actinomycetota bacterium]
MSGVLTRLYRGETTFNFVGRRWWGFGLSLFLIVVTMLSLFTRGLNLGIDFEGGVAWEVPAASITIEDVTAILETNKVDTADAKIQSLNGSDGSRIRVQVAEQTPEVKSAVQSALAEK